MKKLSLFYYVFSFILLVVFVILIVSVYSNLSQAVSGIDSNETKSVIIIDAGHGGEDGGAVADKIVEKDINLAISKKLADIFISNGFEVITTRNDDDSVETEGNTTRERKVSDMKHRLETFNSDENNIVVSIHQNKFTENKYNGTQIFYSTNNPQSAVLAESIKNSVVSLIQPDNQRQCKKAGNEIYLLYNSKVPSVIVECGFISNREEAQKLSDENYQKQMAWAIFLGVLDFTNNNKI
ncbi:MAG: N-acetylmuramoyl-L-alanine amidase [Oscillospiraceae bacterium]|nr:N-acetylmuramoyl-L-alanine amidase [Oscillospiraceae bacterium]